MIYLHFRKSTNFIENKKKIEINDIITLPYTDRDIISTTLTSILQMYKKDKKVKADMQMICKRMLTLYM